jgi:tRNA pseudouridine13 synthase
MNDNSSVLPYKIKYLPEDFQVNECYIIDQSLSGSLSNYHLLNLHKKGHSTFDAIRLCSEHLDIPFRQITYYGLKDEDAITQQVICVKLEVSQLFLLIEKFNQKFSTPDTNGYYIRLTYLQVSSHPLKIGGVLGNSFLLTLRGLPQSLLPIFSNRKYIEFSFVNYYGCQRFGLPGEIPLTHRIGEAILKKDYEGALKKIAAQNNTLGAKARQHNDNPQIFFECIDSREKNFFINSYYSFKWNEEVKNTLRNSNIKVKDYSERGIHYLFPEPEGLKNIYMVPKSILCTKVDLSDSKDSLRHTPRPTIVQVFLYIEGLKDDDHFPELYKVKVKFILPTGCYATMAMAQFFNNLMIEQEDFLLEQEKYTISI